MGKKSRKIEEEKKGDPRKEFGRGRRGVWGGEGCGSG